MTRKLRKPVCQKNLTRQYTSSPRKDKSGYGRSERDYKGLQRAQVALPVWPAHHPCHYPEETMSGDPL